MISEGSEARKWIPASCLLMSGPILGSSTKSYIGKRFKNNEKKECHIHKQEKNLVEALLFWGHTKVYTQGTMYVPHKWFGVFKKSTVNQSRQYFSHILSVETLLIGNIAWRGDGTSGREGKPGPIFFSICSSVEHEHTKRCYIFKPRHRKREIGFGRWTYMLVVKMNFFRYGPCCLL